MLPNLGVFESFLRGVVLSDRPPDSGEGEPLFIGDGDTNLWISYPAIELKPSSVIGKICESLKLANSPASYDVGRAVLATIAESAPEADFVSHANAVLSRFREGELLLNHVTPFTPRAEIAVDYGPITVGPFDPAPLRYWARRGRSNWPFDIDTYVGCTSLSRRFRSLQLLNFDALPNVKRFLRRWPGPIADAYFHAVAATLKDQMMEEFEARMSLLEAAGINRVDLASVLGMTTGVYLFTWKKTAQGHPTATWALCTRPSLNLNTPPTSFWTQATTWTRGEFGFDQIPVTSEISASAQSFARLVQAARNHRSSKNFSEAFLYHVIALDQLLGEDGRNTETVTTRAAVLSHLRRAETFERECQHLKRLYGLRSRFVHQGIAVDHSDLNEVDQVTRSVLWAILYMCSDGHHSSRESWVVEIDRLASILRGDPTLVTEDRLERVGCRPSFRTEEPPPLIRDDWEV